jgi:hypothetical protein
MDLPRLGVRCDDRKKTNLLYCSAIALMMFAALAFALGGLYLGLSITKNKIELPPHLFQASVLSLLLVNGAFTASVCALLLDQFRKRAPEE